MTPDMGVRLEFEHVSKRFGQLHVLTDAHFTIGDSLVVGLIGDNGAGKTTLIRLVAGLLRPTAGAVRVLGRTSCRDDPELMRRLGALIEKPGHYDELTVADNLRHCFSFYADPSERGSLANLVTSQLGRFGLADVATRTVGYLSSGYRQRLALARAVHPWADVVLLDEPLDSLDPQSRHVVKGVLRDCRTDGKLVLLSSHTLTDIEQICDEIFLVARGRVHRFASFEEIRRRLGSISGDDLDAVYTRLTEELVG